MPTTTAATREVKCLGGMGQRNTASVFHVLPERPQGCCWHCCEAIEGTVLPLPRHYDAEEGVFHVYGATCSPGCAKAYILEHTTFDRGHHLDVLIKMLREVYGVTGSIAEAPPRPAMRRFGGAFDPKTQRRAECRLVEPPFVSYCMLVEERAAAETLAAEEAEALDEPPPPGLYADYVQRASTALAPAAPSTKRPRPPPSSSASGGGPMSRFVRSKPSSK